MHKRLFEFLQIAIGCLIFLISLSFDWLYQGWPGIGFQQFVGMMAGLTIILIGLRYKLFPVEPIFLSAHPKLDWLLFVVYLSVILSVGLWPTESSNIYQISLIGTHSFGEKDFVLNVMGFIPLGFLILPLVGEIMGSKNITRLIAIAALTGFSASLVIEVLQYLWVPGRYSSAYDLVANTFGTIIGALCWLSIASHRLIPLKI